VRSIERAINNPRHTNTEVIMNRFIHTAAICVALLFSATAGTDAAAASLNVNAAPDTTLSEALESSTRQARGEALRDVIYLANVEPAGLDAESLIPVLFTIARSDSNPQFRVMAVQAIALLGSRTDVRNLQRIARHESSPEAKRQMQLSAAGARNR
jgi:hypothetical protein